jgi:hypothetical protein
MVRRNVKWSPVANIIDWIRRIAVIVLGSEKGGRKRGSEKGTFCFLIGVGKGDILLFDRDELRASYKSICNDRTTFVCGLVFTVLPQAAFLIAPCVNLRNQPNDRAVHFLHKFLPNFGEIVSVSRLSPGALVHGNQEREHIGKGEPKTPAFRPVGRFDVHLPGPRCSESSQDRKRGSEKGTFCFLIGMS